MTKWSQNCKTLVHILHHTYTHAIQYTSVLAVNYFLVHHMHYEFYTKNGPQLLVIENDI